MENKRLYIIKAGTTFPETARQFGDFDQWTASALGMPESNIAVVNAERGDALPLANDCAGVVITGSHAMVTEKRPWSVAIEKWLPLLLAKRIPILGICYGHQLLAQAAGGEVGFHPQGKEIGTVEVSLDACAADDPLFSALPSRFATHVTHAQTVLQLPKDAKVLAANDFEPHQAFRLGHCAWGVQFHPEYHADIMRSYIEQQAEELLASGWDVAAMLSAVQETPIAAEILQRFGKLLMSEPVR